MIAQIFFLIDWLIDWLIDCQIWYPQLTQFSRYWAKPTRGYFWCSDSGQLLIDENFHDSRTSNNINMKLRPVTKLDKRNTLTLKTLMMRSCHQILTPLSTFKFMSNLEQSGSRIPDSWSVKLTFSLIVSFYLTKAKRRTKKSLTQLSYHCFE